MAIALSRTTDPAGSPIEVVIGLPRLEEETWRRQEAELRAGWAGCVVRHLGWERVGADLAKRMYPKTANMDVDGIPDVMLPRDWGWNFVDCDAWIVLADARLGAVLPVKPTAYYVRDLAQRYVPSGFSSGVQDAFWTRQTEAFRMWRQSPCVFTTDAATATDITSYAGVRRDRVATVPFLPLEMDAVSSRGGGSTPRVLWLAEPNARHDIAAAMDGLRLLFAEGAALKVIVAGEGAAAFGDEARASLAGTPQRALSIVSRLEVETLTSEEDIQRLLRRVDLVWGSAVADGESEAMLRASQASLPFVGLDFPQNRRFAEHLGVRSSWYGASTASAIADALAEALASIGNAAAGAPTKSRSIRKRAGRTALSPVVERLWSGQSE